ncbi:hypothetical protein [Halorussus halophilus]|uniref:hypothetical protein n=1 Tax=Halorussus halophilus TaxID=2650975 RepID=UPI0013011BED|nr:hypothetical protein [Halorussus halophilus]
MAPLTRRHLLHGTTALLATLAGCGGESTTTSSSSANRFENVEKNPEQYPLRNSGDEQVVWTRETADGNEGDSRRHLSQRLFADASSAKSLVFADVDGKAEAEQFVADTDFDTETLYVEQNRVNECFEEELCYVSWSATEIDTSYGRRYRDADVECSVEVRDTVAQLIRVPDTLDPDEVTGYGSGGSSGGCRYPPPLQTTGETTTWAETETKNATRTTGTTNQTTETEGEN